MRTDANPTIQSYQALLKQAAETCSRKEAISLINAATRIKEQNQARAALIYPKMDRKRVQKQDS